MTEIPTGMVTCTGSGLPTDVVDDMTEGLRSYMCTDCGAAMTEAIATSHLSRLD